jgi:RHS repeat-associated protein
MVAGSPDASGQSPLLNLNSYKSTGCLPEICFFMSVNFLLLQSVNEKVNNLSVKLDYSEPKIYSGGVDVTRWSKFSKVEQRAALKKSWFVYYSYRNPKTGKLKRQPHIKAGVNRLKTKRERGSISQSEIIDENNYYPFGLEHKGYNSTTSGNVNSVASKFKYNGKELEEGLGYNMYEYEARHYDASLGRFVTIDPLAEDYYFQSPYIYAANDPVRFIDKLGMGPLDWIKNLETGEIKWYDASGDKAIQMAAEEDDKNKVFNIEVDKSVKGKYKNLGGDFFGSKGDNFDDNSKMNKQREEYISEVASDLNNEAGVDFYSDENGNGIPAGNVTEKVLKEIFMDTKSKSKNQSEIVNFAEGQSQGFLIEEALQDVLSISSKAAGTITSIMTVTETAKNGTMNSVHKRNAMSSFNNEVKPLLTNLTLTLISHHKF